MNIVLVLKLRLKQTHIQGQANREEFGHASTCFVGSFA